MGALPSLRVLSLGNNKLTDDGIQAFASAVAAAANPAFLQLEMLNLSFNQIEGGGMASLALAIGDGALPALHTCWLLGNRADEGVVQQALLQPSAARRDAGGGGYLGGGLVEAARQRNARYDRMDNIRLAAGLGGC